MFLLSNDYWEVRETEKKGRGIFAKKAIAPGTVIGDYIGTIIKSSEQKEDDVFFALQYHDRAVIEPDPQEPGVHLFNHSCMPNCWMYTYHGHALYFTTRHIFAGEELTVNYLIGTKRGCTDCNHYCYCETKICKKTMHISQEKQDLWNDFDEKNTEKTKRHRIRYGQRLSPLSSYPTTLPDHASVDVFGSEAKPPRNISEDMLSVTQIRELLRTTGQQLRLPTGKLIVGVDAKQVVTH